MNKASIHNYYFREADSPQSEDNATVWYGPFCGTTVFGAWRAFQIKREGSYTSAWSLHRKRWKFIKER